MSTIGFLHTADVHRATFTALVGELAPGARTVDAIVLAPASMASAAGRCRSDAPVLSSPRLAVEHAVNVISV